MTRAIERVVDRIDRMRDEIVTACVSSISMPSINPSYPGYHYDDLVGGERDVSRLLGDLCGSSGAEVGYVAKSPGRDNLVARFAGTEGAPSLALVGHVDVVPPGPSDRWTRSDPFSATVHDGRLYGRGAADQKAGLVAQTMAMASLNREGIQPPGDVIVAAVVGEEMMEHDVGITAVIEEGLDCSAAIVSEATSPPLKLGVAPITPGLLWFRLHTRGKPSHTSLRGLSITRSDGHRLAVNAIERALIIMDALRELERTWIESQTHPLFPKGHFSIMPGVIRGGFDDALVPFVTPNSCSVDYTVWYHPEDSEDSVKSQIESAVYEACEGDPWLTEHPPTIDWKLHWPPASSPVDSRIAETVAEAHRVANGSEGSGKIQGFLAMCDGSFLTAAGIPSVVYGPGSITSAHTSDEHVDVDEVIAATKTYAVSVLNWGMVGP